MKLETSRDEEVRIEDSALIKTMVHNCSNDPETLEQFYITDTISTHYANIHGSPSAGCFMGPFSTVDLTTMRNCVIGAFSYIQAGEINHLNIEPGTVWVCSPGDFNFKYQYNHDQLNKYISFSAGKEPQGLFINFMEDRKGAFQQVFDVVNPESSVSVPDSSSLDKYAVTISPTHIGENVFVSQRAFLQNAWLGNGTNAQENCFIINSRLEGYNVTAHGTKIIDADLGQNVFVGFNSFLHGRPDGRLAIGKGCIIMPHTIIDIRKPLSIPADHLVWGLITDEKDLDANSLSINTFSKIEARLAKGNMVFEGCGKNFIAAFKDRIYHILEANGAFFNGVSHKGHAQMNKNISFNTIQSYPRGALKGLYPTIDIRP